MSNPASRAAAALAVGLGLAAGPASAEMALFQRGAPMTLNVTSFRDIPFRTVVRQRYDYSCGSASLATLLSHHYGRPTSETEVFKAMFEVGDQKKIQDVGFSLLDMRRYLNSLGYKAEGYRITLPELMASTEPAITMITLQGYRHFVVLKGVRDGKLLVGDPALGLKTYTQEEFARIWDGVILVIEEAGRPAFNREAEWRPYGAALTAHELDDSSLSALTRELPPLYQVSPMVRLP